MNTKIHLDGKPERPKQPAGNPQLPYPLAEGAQKDITSRPAITVMKVKPAEYPPVGPAKSLIRPEKAKWKPSQAEEIDDK